MAQFIPLFFTQADCDRLQEIQASPTVDERQSLFARILLRINELQANGDQFTMSTVAREYEIGLNVLRRLLNDYRTGGCNCALDWRGTAKMRTATTQAMVDQLSQLLETTAPGHSKHGKWTTKVLTDELRSRGFRCSEAGVRTAIKLLRGRDPPACQ